MAAEGQVDIDVKMTADLKGGLQTESELDAIRKKAKAAASDSKSGFESFGATVGKVGGIVRGFTKALGMIGFAVHGIQAVVSAFEKLNSWIHRNETAAKELRERMSVESAAKEIKAVADSYKELTAAIAETAAARSRENELFDEEVRVRREAQDAEMAAAEADAIAAVDPNAEDADRQKQRIRERFAADRARKSAERKKEDVVFRRQKLQQQADDATNAADEMEESLANDDKAILRARTRAGTLERLSTMRNEADRSWNPFTTRTEEGDAIREKQRKEAEEARKTVEKLEGERDEKEKRIADLRAQAGHAEKLKATIFASISTADVERETATVNQETAEAANGAADRKESEKKAKEKEKAEDAKRAKDLLTQQKAEIKEKIRAEQDRKAAAGRAVFQAQVEFDSAGYNGNRRDQKAAYDRLQEAKESAQNVEHAADSAINALNETLKRVESRLKAAQSFLDNQSKQQRNAWSESPAGA